MTPYSPVGKKAAAWLFGVKAARPGVHPDRRRRDVAANLRPWAKATGTPGSNGLGLLNQGYVETSNVNVVEELVNMIQTQRAYEINSKSIQASDQMLQKLTQL